MDRLSRKILKFICENSKDSGTTFSMYNDWDYRCDVSFESLCNAVQCGECNARSAIEFLKLKGLLTYLTLNSSTGPIKIGFCPTHAGLHFKEIQRGEKIKFAKNSVLIPVFVSVITNLTIDALQWLLPLIQKWLSSVF